MKKRSKITVLLDEPEFRRFDAFCQDRGYKKSTLIARLVREHLNDQGFTLQGELPLAEWIPATASVGSR